MSKSTIIIIVIAGVVIGMLTLGGIGFAIYKFSEANTPKIPTSAEVCDQVIQISQDYLDENGLGSTNVEDIMGTREDCIKDEDSAAIFRGPEKTKEIRDCIMDAKDFEALGECAKLEDK